MRGFLSNNFLFGTKDQYMVAAKLMHHIRCREKRRTTGIQFHRSVSNPAKIGKLNMSRVVMYRNAYIRCLNLKRLIRTILLVRRLGCCLEPNSN